ncbi:ROK family protein [Archaeoglobus neptunius]|uniref:ROK family protein n=1 Tax=Archaeoglobus neptunius TaxID=2798580 RepID=UPI001926D993|nr:ROK family protein [Archaeoglobus neptunius]
MILGIDIGGTNTDIALMDGENFTLRTIKTSDFHDIHEIIDFSSVEAVGIGIAAWFEEGRIIHSPNLPAIPETDFPKPTVIDNDANCFAYYASRILNCRNLLGITVGTGIGGGIITDGKIYRGRGAAGEIGHTHVGGNRRCKCGGTGHLETYFGGWALSQYGKGAEMMLDTGEIYECEGFRFFCISIANAIMLLHPDAVAVGGRIGGRLDQKVLRERIKEWLPDVIEVEVHTIKDDHAVAKGAAMLARDTILQTHP